MPILNTTGIKLLKMEYSTCRKRHTSLWFIRQFIFHTNIIVCVSNLGACIRKGLYTLGGAYFRNFMITITHTKWCGDIQHFAYTVRELCYTLRNFNAFGHFLKFEELYLTLSLTDSTWNRHKYKLWDIITSYSIASKLIQCTRACWITLLEIVMK